MIKKIFLGLSLLVGTTALAQQGTASPYSFYGIGDVNFSGTNEYKAMGGVDVYSDSIHLNLKNPASFSKLALTTFSLGATNRSLQFKGNQASEKANRSSIDYIAVGIPLGKFGASFGLLPFSSLGYKIQSATTTDGIGKSRDFNGKGGVNKAFAGFSYSVLPNLQIGASFNYNFGITEKTSTVFITNDGSGFLIPKGTQNQLRRDHSGFEFNTGAIYTAKIKGYDWTNTVTYTPSTVMKVTEQSILSTIDISQTPGITPQIERQDELIKNISMPSKISLGTGIGKPNKWFIGAEFTHSENSKLNAFNNSFSSAKFEDAQKFAVGGFYIPKYNSFTSYLDRIVYRGGFRYENTGLVLADQAINDYAVSLGAGFPVGRNLSNLNISLEYGQKGTNKNNLIKENYFNISVGLSLNDLWFVKRKFD